MRILAKNLLKSLSRSSLYIPRRRPIFKSGSAAENNNRLLLRRFRWSGLNEDKIFSDLSPENFTSSTKLCSLISADFNSPDKCPFFCGTSTKFFSALSPHNLSPTKAPNFPHFNDYSVVDSCGGVVCLDNVWQGAVFWNPSTNEVKFLPRSDVDRPNPAEAQPLTIDTFAFTSGFGFDSKTQDYKYIRWVTFYFVDEEYFRVHDHYTIVELYSLKTDSWKRISCPDHCGSWRSSACVGGNFYWTMSDEIEPTEIRRFDFTTEEFSYIPFPPTRNEKRIGWEHNLGMFDFGGKLGVVVYERKGADKSFELLAWDGGRRWWRREFDDRVAGADHPLGFSKDGRFLFLAGTDRRLLAYDVCAKQVVKLDVYCSRYGIDVIPYAETTFPLNGEAKA